MKKTIFMTGGGGAGTIAATKSLKESGRYRVILGDMNRLSAGLRFADKFYILPPGQSDHFLNDVSAIIDKEGVDIFVPLVDEEILKSYDLKKYFPKLLILLPEFGFAKAVLDKWNLVNLLKKNGLPYPMTFLYSQNFSELRFPLIVKPRFGRGSRDVREVVSYGQLRAFRSLLNLDPDKILVQEKVSGKEFTISVVVNRGGRVLAVVPKEVVIKKGVTIIAVTRKNPAIQKLCLKIQNILKANGPFNVQLILRDDGVPVVFEINPRYSTTIALTLASGVNEIGLLVKNKTRQGKLMPFKENLVMARFYDQIFFKDRG